MTIAPCGALVNAAHEPNPAKGLSGTPSTFTATSVRAQAIRTTPSGVEVPLVPEARAIGSGSRRSSDEPGAEKPSIANRMPVVAAGRIHLIVWFIICLRGPL